MGPIDPILSVDDLKALREARLFDARPRPGDAGSAAFGDSHLVGAAHADLESDLSGPAHDPSAGGRHPLPSVARFCGWLGAHGVTPDTHVVVYDDLGGANAAARLWWMLRALGHARVQVLDGGMAAAQRAGLECEPQSKPRTAVAPYPASAFRSAMATAAEVETARQDPARCVLDVRAAERFAGEQEPIDPIAGHIPGAVNLPLGNNLDGDGRFKTAVELRAQYESLLAGRSSADLIVHCGSGVTACHSLLALDRAGLPGASLYVGSWSEWCRNDWPREP